MPRNDGWKKFRKGRARKTTRGQKLKRRRRHAAMENGKTQRKGGGRENARKESEKQEQIRLDRLFDEIR